MGGNDYEKRQCGVIKKYTSMYEKTFDWGCNDRAKCLYANAVYSIVSGKEIYKECEKDFLDYMHENGISR